MKRLIGALALLLSAIVSFGQCPPTESVVTWESTTHDYYAPGSPYNTHPSGRGQQSYFIDVELGQSLTFDFKIGNSTTTTYPGMFLSSIDGQYAEIETSHGTLVYDPANGGVNAGSISFESTFPPVLPTPWRTVTIYSNPYPDRDLRVYVAAGTAFVYKPGCSVYQTSLLWQTPFHVQDMDSPILQI